MCRIFRRAAPPREGAARARQENHVTSRRTAHRASATWSQSLPGCPRARRSSALQSQLPHRVRARDRVRVRVRVRVRARGRVAQSDLRCCGVGCGARPSVRRACRRPRAASRRPAAPALRAGFGRCAPSSLTRPAAPGVGRADGRAQGTELCVGPSRERWRWRSVSGCSRTRCGCRCWCGRSWRGWRSRTVGWRISCGGARCRWRRTWRRA
jgi:hypothetical protein